MAKKLSAMNKKVLPWKYTEIFKFHGSLGYS